MLYAKSKTSNSIRYLKNVQSYHVVRKYIGIWKIYQETTHAIFWISSVLSTRHRKLFIWHLFQYNTLIYIKATQTNIGKIVYNSEYETLRDNVMCVNSERCRVIWFGLSLKQQFEQTAAVCCLLTCVCSVTTSDLIQPIILWNSFRIQNWRCHPIRHIHQTWTRAIFTIFGLQKTDYLDANSDRLRINVAVCVWRHNSQNLLQSINLCCGEKLEEVCRMWCGLHWRLM
jgi:hypothetical protein